MAFIYDATNQVWIAGDITDLTATVANNFMQWSQPFDPYQLGFDMDLYDNHYNPITTVQIAQQSVMFNGYGRGIGAESFPVIDRLVGSSVSLSNGSYSFAQLKSAGLVSDSDRIIGAQLYFSDLDRGNISAADAAYVHGTVGFSLQSATKFIVDNGRIVQVEAHIGALNDNFDFSSSKVPPAVEALVFQTMGPEVLPDGSQVILVYTGDGKVEVIKVPNFCFPAGVPIAVPGGATPVEALSLGDLVFAFDPSGDLGRGALVPKRVVRLFHNETTEWLRLSWQEGGEERDLTVTPGHRFLDYEGRFRRIDEIITDVRPTVVLADGSLSQVNAERIAWSNETRHLFEEVEAVAMAAGDGLAHRTGGTWRSYNFEVEDLHTYVAGGVRVHNDSQDTIDLAGNIGRTFGTLLANVLLEDESQFVKVLGGTVLGAITENLAEIITDTGYHLFDGTQLNFSSSASTALRQLNDLPAELLAGVSTSVQSLLIAELGEKLGLEGFGAQLFSTVGTTYLGSVAEQVSNNLVHGLDAFDKVDWSMPWKAVGGSIGVFFGSSLAHELLPAETLEGSIGGSLGSLVGSSLGFSYIGSTLGQSLGLFANFLLPGVGAFLGTLLGTFLGDLFAHTPDPGADFWLFAEKQGEVIVPGVFNYYLYAIARDGFPTETTRDLGQAVLDLSKQYMSNIGAFDMANSHIDDFTLPAVFQTNDPNNLGSNPLIRVLQRMNIEVAGNGSLQFYVNGRQVASAEAMVDGAVTDFLRDSQPIGGDIFLKRAVVNSAGDSSFTIASAMATASEFEHYQENRDVINSLIVSSPDTAFAGTWAYVLAGAEVLGLAQTNQSDFNGGLGGFLASLVDAGIAIDFSQVSVSRGAGGKVFVDVTVMDAATIPTYVNLFSNGATITPSGDGASIRFSFDANMSGVGYNNLLTSTQIGTSARYDVNGESAGRDLWIAPDNKNYNFVDIGTHTIHVGDAEIESSDDIIIAGGGADSIQAGTGWDWISGGAGNDTILGGDQDDSIFGGAGNDLIFGGNQMDYLEGGAGADTINGISPNQTLPPETNATDYAIAGYKNSSAAVNINLGAGTATGGDATGDVLSYIIKLVGSDYNDTLVGDSIANWLEGGAGADILNGGANPSYAPDYASYFHAAEGVIASLANPSVNTGDAAGDTYISIEALEGSNFDDILIGDNGNNWLSGYAGDDILVAGVGADSVKGGFGFDVMSYRSLGSAILIDLANWAGSSAVVADDVRFNYNQPNSMDIEGYEGTDFNDTLRGANSDDVLLGRAGHDSLAGLDGDDALSGDLGNDTLSGQNGNDSLFGGDGNDSLVGGTGDDMIDGGAGADLADFEGTVAVTVNLSLTTTQVTGYGTDTLLGIENVISGSGNDQLAGSALGNSLNSGAGNDTLTGDLGDDTIDGGTGIDTAIFTGTSDATVNLTLTTAQTTGYGTDILLGIENVISGSGNDRLTGNTLANALDGGSGNDSLVGGSGNDTLEGGVGNDTINGGTGVDLADFTGTVAVTVDLSLTTAQVTGLGTDVLLGIENVISGSGKDSLVGSTLANSLNSGGGNDTLEGDLGDDKIDGGSGIDTAIFSGTAAATVDLTLTTAQVTGYGTDILLGIENVTSGGGDDTLTGNTLANALDGGVGNDSLVGADGNDSLTGALGDDTLNGGAGIDTALFNGTSDATVNLTLTTAQVTGYGSDILLGIENVTSGSGNDRLTGNTLGNALDGGSGDDSLVGAAGNDTLEGGVGNDTINGGTGIDLADFTGTVAVTVDLSITSAQVTGLGTDILLGIENLLSGSGNDSLTGNTAANSLNAGSGNDTLEGGLGDDTIDGGSGIDTAIFTGTTAATVNLTLTTVQVTGYGSDILLGIENLTSGNGDDVLTGNTLANALDGGSGNDSLLGGDGNDSLTGGLGDDTIDGGAGIDTALFTGSTAATVNLTLTTAQVTGYGTDVILGIENVTSGSGNDSLTGNALANVLDGGSGDDSLLGGNGNDTLKGGVGNDTVNGGTGVDLADYTGTAAISINLALTTAQATGLGTDILLGIEKVTSGSGNDYLAGNTAANAFDGGSGNDSIFGADGNDTLNGNLGNDTIDGGAGIDTALFTGTAAAAVNLTLATAQVTGYGSDILLGIENVTSGSGNDILTGNAQANALDGGSGNDSLVGGDGDDSLTGNLGNDTIDGGAGIDTAFFSGTTAAMVNLTITTAQVTGYGTDILLGIENVTSGSGNDRLTGDALANSLSAGAGNDTLDGGAGNDTINGGIGSNRLTGGLGADSFVFSSDFVLTNVGRVTDFNVADDTILLDSGVFLGLGVGVLASTAFRANTTGLATNATDRIIYETDTGNVYFDADGNAAGERVLFAVINPSLAMTSADFLVF